MTKKFRSAAIVAACLILPIFQRAWAQDSSPHYEIGTVYYADQGSFKALNKEPVSQSGRSKYSARVKGAHASIRLRADQVPVFRVCGVDPSRFKLYRFKSEGNERNLLIAKTNMLIGGSKTVISESEIPVAIETAEANCFSLTPRNALGEGEFGFSPVESLDAFMFGIGDLKQPK